MWMIESDFDSPFIVSISILLLLLLNTLMMSIFKYILYTNEDLIICFLEVRNEHFSELISLVSWGL